MNMKKTLLITFTLLSYGVFSQQQVVPLFSSDFETSTLTYEQGTTNTWRQSTCAGNGISQPGTNALYASKGGINPGCGADGEDQYAFSAASSTTETIVAYTSVSGECAKSYTMEFDYKLNLSDPSNKAYVVYKAVSGPVWLKHQTLSNVSDWTSITVSLPQTLNNSEFLVGFMFEYGSSDGNGEPLAIDNLFINGIEAGAYIQQDTLSFCNQSAVLIEAEGSISGNGEWVIIPGKGSGIINNPNSPQTGVNNLGAGTNVFVWTVTGTCGLTIDTLVVINSAAPSLANVQDTVLVCNDDQWTVSTSMPISGTGVWTALNGTTIVSPNNPSTLITNIPEGWSQLVWTVSALGCPSNADTMNIFKTGGQTILNADTVICYGTDPVILLEATPISSTQTSEWAFSEGNGLIHSPDSSSTEASGFQMGDNYIVYTVNHPLCPTEVDTILIQIIPCADFEPIFPTVITPNGDGKNDLFVVHNLEKIYQNCQMTIFNRWGNVVFESTGYENPWDGTYKGEKLPMGTYYFKLELKDSESTIYNGSVSIIH
jgi:gliding motility-associated-like protein